MQSRVTLRSTSIEEAPPGGRREAERAGALQCVSPSCASLLSPKSLYVLLFPLLSCAPPPLPFCSLRVPPGALARLNTCLGSHDEKLSLGENNKPIREKGKSSTSTKRRSSLEETAPAKRPSRAAPLARLSETTQISVFRASKGARTSRPPSCSSFWEWVSSRCAPAAAVRWGGRAHHASAAHTPSPAPTGGETTCSSQGST